ncbi:MAG: hypothetical protein K2N80_06020 [Lachnospiraceae bacterium]|nr:hypothetical protein [Lachnospiraceae bacterium]
MNENLSLWKRWIEENRGKVSFAVSLGIILLLDRLKIMTFDSVMPYLAGTGIWAALWSKKTFFQKKWMLPAVVSGVAICVDLCIEGFLAVSPNPVGILKFLVMYGIVLLIVGGFGFQIPSEKFPRIIHVIGCILFGLFSSAGNYSVFEKIALPDRTFVFFLLLLLSFFSWSVLFGGALNAFHFLAGNMDCQRRTQVRFNIFFVWGGVFLVCLICYFPYFLTYYPGVIEYDSWKQLQQVFGAPYKNHHPWIHTMLIKAVYHIGFSLFKSENRAVALYSLCSMSMLAFAFATSIACLYRKGVKKSWLLFLLAFYALSPINGMYSISMWKDIPFATFMLLYIILLYKLVDNARQQQNSLLYWSAFVPVGFLVCFFRTNGLYMFLLMIPFTIYLFRKRLKPAIVSLCMVICLIVAYKGFILPYFQVEEVDLIESLSIPAQQIAAAVSYGGDMAEEDMLLLEEIIDTSRIPEAYLGSPNCSDAIKILVRETDNQQYIAAHKGSFLLLWLRTGIRNPYYYFKAYVDETFGYWYHKVRACNVWATYIFEGAAGLGIERECKMPGRSANIIPALITWYRGHFDKYFSCGIYIYLLLFGFLESLRQKKENWFAAIPLFCVWFTLLISTPLYADLRYIYAIHATLPFVMIILFLKDADREAKNLSPDIDKSVQKG